jgi:hypothetical protein
MFGKPEWFKDKAFGYGFHPVTWQGWVYTVGWLSFITFPFLLLIFRKQPLEATIWINASILALFFDVRQIKQERDRKLLSGTSVEKTSQPEQSILFIEDETKPIGTKNYDMRVR